MKGEETMRTLNIRIAAISLLIPLLIILLVAVWKFSVTTGTITPPRKSAVPYSYLPVSIESYYKPEQFMRMMAQCGFSDVSVHSLSLGIATIYRGTKE
jgi:ubiquinone/menaquinone biosynthesis C-methylase UbiE